MHFLILGGTQFVGRHLVECALSKGHRVTLFNRGHTNPGLFDDVEEVHGDRDGELELLKGRSFDRVLDVSGYLPRVVRQSAELLRGQRTTTPSSRPFPSTPTSRPRGSTRTHPLRPIPDVGTEDITRDTYGPLKALCEEVVRSVYQQRCTIVRPGIVAGPFDDTDRFTYWCVRVSKGGDFVAPDGAGRPVQFIDARDLAGFTLKASEDSLHGVFNATGPLKDALSWGDFLESCVEVAASDSRPVWVPERVLREADVNLGRELPLYAPLDHPGFATVDSERAIAAGLEFSPLDRTVEDTLRWAQEEDQELSAGMTKGREEEILEALRRSRL